jgi:cell fate regulator YaaT (PSP1 superfamily)
MCCLRFESDVYAEEIKLTPAVDSWVKTEDGVGTVISTNPLAGTVRVLLKDSPDTPPKQFHRNEVTVLERRRREATADEGSNDKK